MNVLGGNAMCMMGRALSVEWNRLSMSNPGKRQRLMARKALLFTVHRSPFTGTERRR